MANRRVAGRVDDLRPILAFPYARVSSGEQEKEGLSKPAQKESTDTYIVRVGAELGEGFEDTLTGRRLDRPGYQQLLGRVRQAVSEGRRVMVVVWRIDRLGRNMLEALRCAAELWDLGVEIHSVSQGGVQQRVTYKVLALMAEEESLQSGERIGHSKQYARSGGWWAGGIPPWGYRLRERTEEERAEGAPMGVLVPNPPAMRAVQEAFARLVSGESFGGVQRWAAGLSHEERDGRSMNWRWLWGLMHQPVYIARQREASSGGAGDQEGERAIERVLARPVGRWEPAVSDAVWAQAQRLFQRNRLYNRREQRRHLLSGVLRCHVCGARMIGSGGSPVRETTGRAARYVCQGGRLGVRAPNLHCKASCLEEQLDEAVLACVAAVLKPLLSLDGQRRAHLERAWRELARPTLSDDHARLVRALTDEAEREHQRRAEAGRMYVDKLLDRVGYDDVRQGVDQRLEQIDKRLSELRGIERQGAIVPLPPLKTVLAQAGDWFAELTSADLTVRRDTIDEIVAYAEPAPIRRGEWGANVVLRPHWQTMWQVLGEALYGDSRHELEQLPRFTIQLAPAA